jgi:hypothetical protein
MGRLTTVCFKFSIRVNVFPYLAALLFATSAYAQSSLRPCLVTEPFWTNCVGFSNDGIGSYVGEFQYDKFQGQGTYTWSNGDKYVGEFRGGKYHGQGSYTFSDGRKYVGEWRGDKQNGQGIEYAANGTIDLSGMWADGQLLQSFPIDTARFPFSASSGVEAGVLPIQDQNKKTSVGIVNDCLAKGLKPGTSQFSKCVAGQ